MADVILKVVHAVVKQVVIILILSIMKIGGGYKDNPNRLFSIVVFIVKQIRNKGIVFGGDRKPRIHVCNNFLIGLARVFKLIISNDTPFILMKNNYEETIEDEPFCLNGIVEIPSFLKHSSFIVVYQAVI